MLKTNKIFINGLKELEDLEKGIYPKTSKTSSTSKTHKNNNKFKIDFSQLLSLEKGWNITNHDDLQDHDDMDSEFDEVVIPSQDDVFNKKKININISNNVSLINTFPNALLLEGSIFNKSDKKEEVVVPKIEIKENLSKKPEDIWDILNQIKKENNSESLDMLSTDKLATDIVTDMMATESDILATENMSQSITEEEENNKICKGCNSRGTLFEDQHTSLIVCSECGMVNEELLDHGPEWRQFNNDDNRGEGVNRCGCPSNFFFPKSSQGTIMAGSSNNRLKRKQKWNSMVYKERSLNQVFEYISQICAKNNIPKIIVDSAKILYKKISDCKHKNGINKGKQIIIRGDNRLSIIAACVFKACEMNKNPRNVKEIAELFCLDEKKVTKGNKQFDKIMKNADDNILMLEQFNPNTAEDYTRRHCAKLKINREDTDMAARIAQNCCKMKLASDHNPQSVAAGSILVMVNYCNLNIDKKEIAKLFGTSDVTVSKIYNKIAPYADALVDDMATDHLIKTFKING